MGIRQVMDYKSKTTSAINVINQAALARTAFGASCAGLADARANQFQLVDSVIARRDGCWAPVGPSVGVEYWAQSLDVHWVYIVQTAIERHVGKVGIKGHWLLVICGR